MNMGEMASAKEVETYTKAETAASIGKSIQPPKSPRSDAV